MIKKLDIQCDKDHVALELSGEAVSVIGDLITDEIVKQDAYFKHLEKFRDEFADAVSLKMPF